MVDGVVRKDNNAEIRRAFEKDVLPHSHGRGRRFKPFITHQDYSMKLRAYERSQARFLFRVCSSKSRRNTISTASQEICVQWGRGQLCVARHPHSCNVNLIERSVFYRSLHLLQIGA